MSINEWEALMSVWEKKGPRITRYFRRKGFRRAVAEDLAQQTLLRAAQRLRGRDIPVNLGAYLWRVAFSQLADECQRKDRERQLLKAYYEATAAPCYSGNPDESLDNALSEAKTREVLEAAVRELNEPQQSIIRWYFYKRMRLIDIATVLDCRPQTVFNHLHKALKNLMIKLKDFDA